MVLDVLEHLLFGHTVGMRVGVEIVNQIVGAVTHFALFAIQKRIGKRRDMAACLPNARMHQNIRIDFITVFALLNEAFAPSVFDIVFQARAQGTVVPSIGKPAVYIAAGENKPSVFAKCNDFFHRFFRVLKHC